MKNGLQEAFNYKENSKGRFSVKGEGSLALAAIQEGAEGVCKNLSNFDKQSLLKAAVGVNDCDVIHIVYPYAGQR